MSHITTIDLRIDDLDALSKACERLGLELIRGQKTFRGYTQGKCDHAMRVKGATETYEIGLAKRKDGKGFDLKWDGHMGATYGPAKPLYDAVGYEPAKYPAPASISKLKDWYAAEVTRKQMLKRGFMVRANQREGQVEILCSR
jgi:hypothetical protein